MRVHGATDFSILARDLSEAASGTRAYSIELSAQDAWRGLREGALVQGGPCRLSPWELPACLSATSQSIPGKGCC